MAGIAERLADLAGGLMLDAARVVAVQQSAPGFVAVTLQSDVYRGKHWTPGAKLQIRPFRGSLTLRTYTPVGWDAAAGSTELIAYAHGTGPAAEWFRRAAVDARVGSFGPRRSIDLTALGDDVLFAGDESGVGLALALATLPPRRVQRVFEATDPADLGSLLAARGLAEGSAVVERGGDAAALIARLGAAVKAADTAPDLVLTGDAATVHAVRRAAKTWARQPKRILGKAYWAEGRTGLD